MRTFAQFALTISLAAALLVGCGGSQPPISAPYAMQQNYAKAPSTYQVLYSFAGRPDAAEPLAGLVDVNGTLYGTTYDGGSKDQGTVFTIATGGAENVLYSFSGPPDGDFPRATLVDVGATLYGTTLNGGSRFGTIFDVTTSGTEKVLYAFRGKPDSRRPLAAMIDVRGTLYGTTSEGGGSHQRATGDGTVFSVTMDGSEKVLHSFGRRTDGRFAGAPLIDVGGTFYGTTMGGGAYGNGTVFTITTGGAEKVLYSFRGPPDGGAPSAGLVQVGGALYGTTTGGGVYNNRGTVYSVSTSGTEKVLHSFGNGADGARPIGSLIDVKGTLYGATEYGGAGACGSPGCGTVFSISTAGTEKAVHSFGGYPNDGAYPYAGLIDVKGTLYATTSGGGAHRKGTVFALTP